MDSVPNRSVALLSIRPPFVERILSGEKTVEFRRTSFPDSLATVVVYCTAPVQRVVAYFSVREIVVASPAKLWRLYHRTSGIARQSFFEYYEGCQCGSALRIGKVTPLTRPISLRLVSNGMKPPQSVRYLDDQLYERVRSYTT